MVSPSKSNYHHSKYNDTTKSSANTTKSTYGQMVKKPTVSDSSDSIRLPNLAKGGRKPTQSDQRSPLGAAKSSSNVANLAVKKTVAEESTQTSGKDESDRSSRFYFGYVVPIRSESTNTTNEYLLTRRIGRGGFSEVRLGKLRSNRACRYAVKVVDLKKPKAQRIGRQPHWEIDLLKKLENSDYVIQLFDYKIIENDCIFLVLELGGQSLDTVHKGRRGKAAHKPAYYRTRWKQCVKCVQQVHDLEIIHCDIKPNNFIRVGNLLKIIDFGCATPLGPLNESVLRKKALGTTRFMSPEYLRDKVASKGLDVWSLGCTLFWLLTGQKVFKEPKMDLRRVITTKPPDLSPLADQDAKDLLVKIFNHDHRKRPSCEEILKSKFLTRSDEPAKPVKKTSRRTSNNRNSKD